jgi:hypothetical protein
MMTFASARERNHSRFRHSSRITKLAVEAFCNAILPRLARLDQRGADPLRDAKGQDRLRHELRAVIAAQDGRRAPLADQARQDFDHAWRADTAIDIDRQSLLRELVGDRQALELLTIGAAVEHEIVGPYSVRPALRLRPRPSSSHALPRALARQLQAGGPPQPVCSARAHTVAVAPEKDADAAIAVALILCRQLLHPPDDRRVLAELPALVAQRRSRHLEQRAGPPHRETTRNPWGRSPPLHVYTLTLL